MASNEKKNVTPEEFVFLALTKLRSPGYKGVHVVYSGFNHAFREYFKEEGLEPRELIRSMAEEGKIKFRLCRGGGMIYYPHDIDGDNNFGPDNALEKMGLKF